jgi:UDP-galactopyranose mutase
LGIPFLIEVIVNAHLPPAGNHPGNFQLSLDDRPLLICFSHLRWSFVFQRPQHLMSRFAQTHQVIFWEEPIYADEVNEPRLHRTTCPDSGVVVLTPELSTASRGREEAALSTLLDEALAGFAGQIVRWYYTPMMLPFSEHLAAACTVYDCMDELSAFKNAPPDLLAREQQLLERADIVFTGGTSLYEAKCGRHSNVHAFPSSIDASHFGQARGAMTEPAELAAVPRPRFGFCGVIDERMDLDLLAAVADAHPEWSVVMIGPVVKISEADLPRRANIHYLGSRPYAELPRHMSGWDVALMPFALNEATRFISPTKTPEYLAAGCTVVSTPIVDVVRHYGSVEGVFIADTEAAFVDACERALALRATGDDWRHEADALLARGSWSSTALQMLALIAAEITARDRIEAVVSPTSWPARRDHYDVMVVGAGFAGAVMRASACWWSTVVRTSAAMPSTGSTMPAC